MPVKLCHFCFFAEATRNPVAHLKWTLCQVVWGHNTGSSLNLGAFYIMFDGSVSVTWFNKQKNDLKMVMNKD